MNIGLIDNWLPNTNAKQLDKENICGHVNGAEIAEVGSRKFLVLSSSFDQQLIKDANCRFCPRNNSFH